MRGPSDVIRQARSLRGRLLWILLPPMIVVASGAALWRYQTAWTTAERLYDKTLLAVTLAISAEVSTTGGDLLAEEKLELLTRYLGDQIFYRVDGPGEGIVTGYADAPTPPEGVKAEPGKPLFFSASYRGEPVRAAIYRELVVGAGPDSLSGWMQVTAWQTIRQRQSFASGLARRSLWLMAAIVVVAGLVLWFGVRSGLQPLLDLEAAVAKRSQSNLSPIARSVPSEVVRLVGAMNALFGRLRDAMTAREVFIGDAAHQLRNPIAAIRSQAEAAAAANDPAEISDRLAGVADAAHAASRLAQQLLSSEKARSGIVSGQARFDLGELVAEVARAHAPEVLRRGGDFSFDGPGRPLPVTGDEAMIREAVENLLDNARRYGLGAGGRIEVGVSCEGPLARITVADDGPGVPKEARTSVFDRFKRAAGDVDGCGLGLAIVRDVARAHDGDAWLEAGEGACFTMTLRCAPGGRP